MHRFQGFPDLRANRNGPATEASLWPSFTDIMTVILMVFMLTMVVVIIKNADLITQIRLSRQLQAESEVRLADSVQVLADLRLRNTDLEEALRSTRMEIILLTDEMQQVAGDLEIKAAAIARLEGEKEELAENLRLIRLQLAAKDQDLADAQVMIGGLREEAARTNRQLSLEIAQLLSRLEANAATLLVLSDEKSDLEMALARQRKDFSSLEDKYLKLVRPARSALGKQVASVQFLKRDDQPVHLFKDIGGDHWQEITRTQLFQRLDDLKRRLGDELYIKIVIPDDSGLSYNEAWDFTKTVLSRYDYYYIDGW